MSPQRAPCRCPVVAGSQTAAAETKSEMRIPALSYRVRSRSLRVWLKFVITLLATKSPTMFGCATHDYQPVGVAVQRY
jgi:hypothetical protein